MDYVIAVRSHKRAETLKHKTYKILQQNNLTDRLFVFVGSDEVEDYKKVFTDCSYNQIVPSEAKNGAEKFKTMTEFFPIGKRIVFMDDDLDYWYYFNKNKVLIKNNPILAHFLEDGFKTIDEQNLGAFTCHYSTNKLFLGSKPFKEFRPAFCNSCFFGMRNDPELIYCPSRQDDPQRTNRLLKKYGGVLYYLWMGFKNDFGKGAGGCSEEDIRNAKRIETTKKDAEELFASGMEFFSGVKFNKNYNFWDLKFKTLPQSKKVLQQLGKEFRQIKWENGFPE